MRDISFWQEGDISLLSSRENKRYNKRKSAIAEYFTTEAPIEEIALRNHLSSGILVQMAENCVMQHEDGQPWGYRALLPGVTVIDYALQPATDEAVSPGNDTLDVD